MAFRAADSELLGKKITAVFQFSLSWKYETFRPEEGLHTCSVLALPFISLCYWSLAPRLTEVRRGHALAQGHRASQA